MTRYLEQLNETTDPVTGDFLPIYDASAGATDKDRKVNISRFAILANAQSFTNAQTFTAGIISNPITTGVAGVNITPFAGTSVGSVSIQNSDNGASFGPFISIGRNSNGSTPASGWIRIFGKTGNANDIWADASAAPGILRIGNATGTSTDLGGSIVGAQTSSLDQKNVIEEFVNNDAALDVIANTPLFRFRYKDKRFGNQEYLGVITDYSPLFGTDPDEAHPRGRILNEISAHGYAMAAIKALLERVEKLESNLHVS
jgi:hypothetical protein